MNGLGVPIDCKPGKGQRIDYGRSEIYQIVLFLEMNAIGITPKIITDFIKQNWSKLLWLIFKNEIKLPSGKRLLVFFESGFSDKDNYFQIILPNKPFLINVEDTMNKRGIRHFSAISISKIVEDLERQYEILGLGSPAGEHSAKNKKTDIRNLQKQQSNLEVETKTKTKPKPKTSRGSK